MVSRFARSLTFPISTKAAPSHLRSTSLPCHFHPLVSHLNEAIQALRTWQFDPNNSSLTWTIDGLVRLNHLYDSFIDLIHLQQSQNTLCTGRSTWTDGLLNNYLRLADAHGTFRSGVVALRQHHSATQAAIRARDEAWSASCVRAQRRAEKELGRLGSAVRHVASPAKANLFDHASEAELAGILSEVTMITAKASAAIFTCVAAVSSAMSMPASRWSRYCSVGSVLSRSLGKEFDHERVEAFEESMRTLEEESERFYKSLVKTRVFLLNILSPCI